ncbi:DUF2637 domain-containing protein, partial [Kitasatospora sp. NE20-6]|uniref:DUF2637 domain-containing protein n=1 Tax=Kitasatospora sp. NE20-6 TaxID=2859066 RepID=UPI0038B2ABCE
MEPTSGVQDHHTKPNDTAPATAPTAAEDAAPGHRRGEQALLGLIVLGSAAIAAIGFTGSYESVLTLAQRKGFGWFSYVFPVGIDVGIAVILALDVYYTWKRMPFWPLRTIAWLLTAGTIAFNASVSWPDPLGTTMHSLIPTLFVTVVEAARHAVRRTANLADHRRMDSIRRSRWALQPLETFRMWRRMVLWEIRSYDEVVHLERARILYRAELRHLYGRRWRSHAPLDALRPLRLASFGIETQALLQALADTPQWSAERLDVAGPTREQTVGERAAIAELEAEPAAGQPSTASAPPLAPAAPDEPSAENLPNTPAETFGASSPSPIATSSPIAADQHTPWPAPASAAPVGPHQTWSAEPPNANPAEHTPAAHPGWPRSVTAETPAQGIHTEPTQLGGARRDSSPEPAAAPPRAPMSITPPAAPATEPDPVPAEPHAAYLSPLPVPAAELILGAAEQPTSASAPVPGMEVNGPERAEAQPAAVQPLSKKDRARLIYLEHQREGRGGGRGAPPPARAGPPPGAGPPRG